MTRIVRSSCVGLLLLVPLGLLAASHPEAMSTRIFGATPARTAVMAEFDEIAVATRLATMESEDQATDGYGIYLAIAGQGTPSAIVTDFELGEAVEARRELSVKEFARSTDELVILSPPAVFHDLRLVTLNFRPIMRDDAGVLRTVRRVEVEVVTEGGGGLNAKAEPFSFSSAFYPLYRMFVANLDELYPEAALNPPGRYLVLGSTTRLTQLQASTQFQSWLDLKRRKGYYVQILSLENPTPTIIGQQIQQAYNNVTLPDLEYVLLIGDHPDLPSKPETNPERPGDEQRVGDNYYFCLAGSDLLPDVIAGRVSGQSSSEYVAYFAKAYGYETDPYRENLEWFRSGTFVAGNNADGGNIFPVTPVWNVFWSREYLMRDGCIANADTHFWHGPTDPPPGRYSDNIRADIDSGVCIVIYRGWANQLGWIVPEFDNGDIEQLVNGRRLPAVYSIVCGTGNFAHTSGPCMGEKFTTGVGTPTQPKGAISFFGASDLHTNTRHNNAILAGIVEAQLRQGIRGAGALGLAGKLEGWRQFPLEQQNGWAWYYVLHVFNLLGDPELQTYLCVPEELTVSHPSELTPGETLVHVNVQAGGQPVAGAVVGMKQLGSTTGAAVRTNSLGDAWVPVSFTSTGTAQLTVWKSRYFTKLADINIRNDEFDPKITGINWTAGADNLPNPGETVDFTLNIQNLGQHTTTPSVTVTSLDERVTVVTGTGTVNTINPGETGTSTSFTITLSGEIFDGERPRLNVQIQDAWDPVNRQMEIPVAAPDPLVISLRVDDGNNGILEAGETAPIWVTVQNVGGQAGSGMTATVNSWDNSIDFPAANLEWNLIPIGGSDESIVAFQAHLANGVAPGRQIQLHFDFEQNGSVIARKRFTLTAGVVTVTAPTGPDAYGYYAYEDIDAGFSATPTYSWVELDPAHGGSGAPHEVRDDTHFAMALPQPFTYYGQSFDSVWICSNGWFSFERATIPEFRNWELPSPIGAPSLVAPFWDDLAADRFTPNDDTLHYVWTQFFDGTPDRFVIQWRTFIRWGMADNPNNRFATFEAILEYNDTGDGDIIFQYDQIQNFDLNGEGNFATVGMEDSYHQRGLTLTFAKFYPVTVDTLRAGRAIRITTTPPDNFSSADDVPNLTLPETFLLHEAYPNPFNPSTQLRFDLPASGDVLLRVFDILGRDVATLADGWHAAGSYQVSFDGRDLPSGLYFARLSSNADVMVRKLMLVK